MSPPEIVSPFSTLGQNDVSALAATLRGKTYERSPRTVYPAPGPEWGPSQWPT
jgi:hypothetical protein